MQSLKLNTLTRPTSFIILQMSYARSISFIYMTLNIVFGTAQNSFLTWSEALNKTETMEKVKAKLFWLSLNLIPGRKFRLKIFKLESLIKQTKTTTVTIERHQLEQKV